MATNYNKWDNLEDSDDEKERGETEAQAKAKAKVAVATEKDRELQAEVEKWLKQQLRDLPEDLGLPKLGPSNRATLARFLVVSHFDKDSTNITRHRDIIDIVRRDSWLEEVGTLQLLCCIHKQASQLWDPHDYDMRMIVYSAINTLAAPKFIEPPGNILDLFAVIADPDKPEEWELRERYQRKEFAKKALAEPKNVSSKRPQKDLKDMSKGEKNAAIMTFFADYGNHCLVVFIFAILLLKMVHRRYSEGSFLGDMSRFGQSPTLWQYGRALMEL